MTVAPLTLAQTAELVCAEPLVDDPEPVEELPEPPMAMPGIGLEPDAELVPVPDAELAPGLEPPAEDAPPEGPDPECLVVAAGEAAGAGLEVASTTVVATSTSTAAAPTVTRPVHHRRAAVPMAALRSDTFWMKPHMAHSSSVRASESEGELSGHRDPPVREVR